MVASFADGTYGLIDYKTSSPNDKNLRLYSRQLQAYVMALQHPAPGRLKLSPITLMGILAVDPVEMIPMGTGSGFRLETSWIEFPRDDTAFKTFLSKTLTLLESSVPPALNPQCAFWILGWWTCR